MVTKAKVRTTIELHPGDKERLQAIAAGLGLAQTNGPGRGQGSVSAMMQAIAGGALTVSKTG